MFEFEFKVGDMAEHVSGQKVFILARQTDECHGGVQGSYICRLIINDGFGSNPATTEGTFKFASIELRKPMIPATSDLMKDLMSLKEKYVVEADFPSAAFVFDVIDRLKKAQPLT